ncbi:hypothetical protein [Achromobacter sp.]|uniref:hypothetical protein n=1 Tax=Achromobacter sp. TaxID=134375 RepID=UPI003C71A3C3
MKDGDTVEVDIEHNGMLRKRIRDETPSAQVFHQVSRNSGAMHGVGARGHDPLLELQKCESQVAWCTDP